MLGAINSQWSIGYTIDNFPFGYDSDRACFGLFSGLDLDGAAGSKRSRNAFGVALRNADRKSSY